MAIRAVLLSVIIAVLAAPIVHAQPVVFSGVDGTISLTFPPGWRRLDLLFKKRLPEAVKPDVEFEADHGDAIRGEPGVACTMKMVKQPLAPNVTADQANKSMRANRDKLPPPDAGEVKSVTMRGPGIEIETRILKGNRNDMVIWQAMYAKDRTLYRPNLLCQSNIGKLGISVAQADLVTAMIAAMKYHVN